MVVSIHASAREATALLKALKALYDVSIHASAREATTDNDTLVTCASFQSTPPRGRRRTNQVRQTSQSTFQSTPPRGRRLRGRDLDGECFHVSIHASAREATGIRWRLGIYHDVSIHASAREATKSSLPLYPGRVFQSTPPRGRRPFG